MAYLLFGPGAACKFSIVQPKLAPVGCCFNELGCELHPISKPPSITTSMYIPKAEMPHLVRQIRPRGALSAEWNIHHIRPFFGSVCHDTDSIAAPALPLEHSRSRVHRTCHVLTLNGIQHALIVFAFSPGAAFAIRVR